MSARIDPANPYRARARLVPCPAADRAADGTAEHSARLSQRLTADRAAWHTRIECRRCGYRAESVDVGTGERVRRQAEAAATQATPPTGRREGAA